ncbi:hypothetical protein [Paenibacillus lutrae]|uniref:Glycosyltransferase RgtA/B/C/D-like domain-containing protein n=1 Tax=Paenibacillus lutrae TaxID=2078573 RepID=A0A7X3FL22_9BACL|nr:hypothetical protein [Paenibacillus lutrae]MVP01459.1 hypothetical protein [Paenibacillus lutrae]
MNRPLKIFIISFIFSLFFCIMLPFEPSSKTVIEIGATGEKNINSKGTEVWIKQLIVDGREIPYSEMNLPSGWEIVNGVPVSVKEQPSKLIWKGKGKTVFISLVSHPYSGKAEIIVNEEISNYDLYSQDEKIEQFEYNTKFSFLDIFKYVLFIVMISGFVYLMIYIITSNNVLRKINSSIIYYMLPLSIWLIYWLAFFPGLMSGDSLDQWRQIHTLELNDAHPAFHTLINWLLTQFWDSPAIISLSQIIFMVIIFGKTMVLLERKFNVSRITLILLCLVISILPVNGMLLNNLWKDIPYSICLLWLTLLLMKVFLTSGNWLVSKKNQALLIGVLILLTLLRHNGFVPAFGIMFCLLIYYRSFWKTSLKILFVVFLSFFIFKNGIYNQLNIAPTPKVLSYSIPIHHIGALLNQDIVLSTKEKQIIDELMPSELWKDNFHKYTVDTLIYNSNFNMRVFDEKDISGDFLKVWLGLTLKNPGIVLKDWMHMTSIVWEMREPINSKNLYTETTIVNSIPGATYNLHSQSKIPSVKETLLKYFNLTMDHNLSWIIWRPALLLLFSLFGFYVLFKKYGWKISIVYLPLMLNLSSIFLAIPAQQLRYIYSATLILPIIITLCFYKRTDK